MADLASNAHRLLQLFELMRTKQPDSAVASAFMQLHALNLSFSHMRLMHMLSPDRTLAMKDLAEQLGLTPPSVTALTRRLLQTGMIERTVHPQDSRIALLSLTASGTNMIQRMYHEQLQRMEELLTGLTPDEQQLFLDLMERAVRGGQHASGSTTPNG